MIALRITYVTGAVRAADFATGNDKSAPEWPPHPGRLFCALVSAWAAAGRPESGRHALEWLERQDAPSLTVGASQRRSVVVSYVPANDEPTAPGRRRRNDRTFPVTVPESDTVYMLWPAATLPPEHREALRQLFRLTPSLGHSSSLVDVRLVDDAPTPDLVPDEVGQVRVRVPNPGRLARLRALFDAGHRPDAGRWQAYAPPRGLPQPVAIGVFGDMIVYRLDSGGTPFPLVGSLMLCAAMRGAALAHADPPVPEVVSGHASGSRSEGSGPSERPHMAFAPLADVGHPRARGHVIGVAAVLPRGLGPADRRTCLRALGGIRELVMGRLGRFPLERLSEDVDRRALIAETWVAPSRAWATVTPVVLDRYPGSPFGSQAETIVGQSCARAGYPVPESVELSRVSWVTGVPAATEFPARREREGRPRRYHVHARVTFPGSVAGPVLIGAGRYYGYGLCRPIEARG